VAADEVFPITGNFPNFATNTSLQKIDFKGTSWGSASQDFSIEFNTFGSQEEGSGCRSTLTDLVIHNTGPGFFSQGFNFEKPIHPDAFKFMISLERIEFRGTFVGGNIPDLIDCESLESIVFQSCGITGQLPSFSGNPMLNEISFPNNELIGQVPSLNLPILQNIFLSNNSIIGFGDLTTPQLQRLYVEDNLIASFPAIGQSTQLRELDLARNLISDYPIVNNAGPLRNLRFIEK
jgi:Leucine-rich repeat (LRR) protein